MKSYQPFRFPPLSQLPRHLLRAGSHSPLRDAAQWQASLNDGFTHGQQEGYQAGLEMGRQAGQAEGYKAGLASARDDARAEARQALDALAGPLDTVLQSLQQLQQDYRAAQREELVGLVDRVARRVIRAELALQPSQILTLIDETLGSLPPGTGDIDIFLNPDELQRLRDIDTERTQRWRLVADPRLDAGECRVRAGEHEVDAGCRQRLAAVLEQVDRQLLAAADAETEQAA